MPRQLALLLCITFILFLFRIDSRSEAKVSRAIWIPSIWMMITGSKAFSLWLSPPRFLSSKEAYLSGNPIDRLVISMLIVIGLIILFRRKIYWSQIVKSNAFLFLFILYCGISVIWSDYPFVSLKRWIKAFGNIIMVLVCLTEGNPIEAIKALIRRCAYVLVPLSVVLIKYYPHIGRAFTPWGGSEFVGVTTSKNMLGNLCLVTGVFFFMTIYSMWLRKSVPVDKKQFFINIVFLIMIAWLLVKANSATSLGALIIGIGIFISMTLLKNNVKNIGIYAFICITFLLIFQLTFDLNSVLIKASGRDMTLTGRTELWKEVIKIGTDPLIGTGYESFWLGERLDILWEKYWWQPNQAHNGYLEAYINLGFIGLFLLLGALYYAYRNTSRNIMLDIEYGKLRMTYLVIVLLYNITEAAFKGLHLIWFVFLLIAVTIPKGSTAADLDSAVKR